MFFYYVKANPNDKYRQFQTVLEAMFEVGKILIAWQKGIGQGKVVIHMRNVPDLPATETVGRREAVPTPATAATTS